MLYGEANVFELKAQGPWYIISSSKVAVSLSLANNSLMRSKTAGFGTHL